MKLSMYSVCLPECDIPEGIARSKAWGFEGMEWKLGPKPTAEKPADWKFETRYWSWNRCALVDDDLVATAVSAADLARAGGLASVSLASGYELFLTEKIEILLDAAKKSGTPMVRLWFPWYRGDANARDLYEKSRKALPQLERMAKDAGVKIVFETHMGNLAATASMMSRLLDGTDPDLLGCIFDPGNMVYEGYESYRMGFELLGPHLAHVHVKNAIWLPTEPNQAGGKRFKPDWALMDEGFADLETLFRELRRVNYANWISVEDFDNSLPTFEKMDRTAKYLHRLLEVTHA